VPPNTCRVAHQTFDRSMFAKTFFVVIIVVVGGVVSHGMYAVVTAGAHAGGAVVTGGAAVGYCAARLPAFISRKPATSGPLVAPKCSQCVTASGDNGRTGTGRSEKINQSIVLKG